MTEQIEWHGGARPVPFDTRVRIFLRVPACSVWHGEVHRAGDCVWEHDWREWENGCEPDRGCWHIVAYEVVA